MSIFTKIMDGLRIDEDDDREDDYLDGDDEEEVESRRSYRSSDSRKVTPMRQNSRRGGTSAGMEVVVVKPTGIDDSRDIIDLLLANKIVNLNLEGLDVSVAQRIIDTSMGATYAMQGNLQKISHYIFLLTPRTVGVSGDVPEYQEGASPVTKAF